MKNYLRSHLRSCFPLALAMLTLLLAGCNTVSSQVTVFHDWPADVKEKTYMFDKQPVQQNNLEYNSYENLIRSKLSQSGFVESKGGNPAFKIAVNYHTEPSDVQIRVPAYYYAWNDPFWRYNYRGPYFRSYYPYGYYGPFGPMWPSDLEVRRWYKHELDMLISEARTGRQLFDIRSSTESLDRTLNTQMANLVESAFKEFPGASGVTKKVETTTVK